MELNKFAMHVLKGEPVNNNSCFYLVAGNGCKVVDAMLVIVDPQQLADLLGITEELNKLSSPFAIIDLVQDGINDYGYDGYSD